MDIILEKDKSKNDMNIINNNNNNPVKGLANISPTNESTMKENNNNPIQLSDNTPLFGSPTVGETIYEFGSHFENPSHVVSEKVKIYFFKISI